MLLLSFVILTSLTMNRAQLNQHPKIVVSAELNGMVMAYADVDLNRYSDLIVKLSSSSIGVYLADADGINFTMAHSLSVNLSAEHSVQNIAVGDFDGDMYSDLLISSTTEKDKNVVVHLCWGSSVQYTCVHESQWLFIDQPQVVDCNCDQISDFLVVVDGGQGKECHLGDPSRTMKRQAFFKSPSGKAVRLPFFPSFVDLDGDLIPEMVFPITAIDSNSALLVNWEVWSIEKSAKSWSLLDEAILPPLFASVVSLFPVEGSGHVVGAPIFEDFNADGVVDALVPVCPHAEVCASLHLYLMINGNWHFQVLNLTNVKGGGQVEWSVKNVQSDRPVTIRAGDFNADGYPDLLIVLQLPNGSRGAFVIENQSPSTLPASPNYAPRMFSVQWTPLYRSKTIEDAGFFDLMETGFLDLVILEKVSNVHRSLFVSSTFEYESTFVKVQVNSPLCNETCLQLGRGPAVTWPGSSAGVKFKTLDGAQLKSAHSLLYSSTRRSLLLPYQAFGLGQSLSFIESMSVGIATWSKSTSSWPHVIPNSRLYIIPNPADKPYYWTRRLYVMPGRVLRESVIALSSFFAVVAAVVLLLQRRESLQDKRERELMRNRFHFGTI